MSQEDFSYKDLTKYELDDLKEVYIQSTIDSMSEEDLRKFVKTIIQDQIKGTVGNEEEREAWKEMKAHFGDTFEAEIKKILKQNESRNELVGEEKDDLDKRIELLEQRKKEKKDQNEDMW